LRMEPQVKSLESALEPKIITLDELQSRGWQQNDSQQQILSQKDYDESNEELSLPVSNEWRSQKQLNHSRRLLDDKWFNDEKMIDIITDIVDHAEKETREGDLIPDYKTRLAAWDRIAEMRGLVTKRVDPLSSNPNTVNLAFLLGNKN